MSRPRAWRRIGRTAQIMTVGTAAALLAGCAGWAPTGLGGGSSSGPDGPGDTRGGALASLPGS